MYLALGAGRIRGLLADCWSESFGCGGLTLASELGQSQLPDVLQKPASKGNSSTIATPLQTVSNAIYRMTSGSPAFPAFGAAYASRYAYFCNTFGQLFS